MTKKAVIVISLVEESIEKTNEEIGRLKRRYWRNFQRTCLRFHG